MKNLSNLENIFYSYIESASENGPEYENVHDRLIHSDDLLKIALKDNEELLTNYNTVTESLDEHEAIASKNHFIGGVKYGFKLALEIFDISLNSVNSNQR